MPTGKKTTKKAAGAKSATSSGQSPRSMSAQSRRMMAQALTELTGLPVSIGGGKMSGTNYRTTNPKKRGR
jgi:hypothetical protein